jgi:phospholipase C
MRAVAILGLVLVLGCGSNEQGSIPAACPADPIGAESPKTPNMDIPYDTHQQDRTDCRFQAGDQISATVGQIPGIPLQHVVILMMENRSFDHYFSGLETVETTQSASNPDPSPAATPVFQYHETAVCEQSPDHEWGPSHLAFDNGKNDGFVAASNPGGGRAMGYYTEDDIPFYYWLARHFAVSDHHFCSLLGPTWPNRLFLVAATSCGFAEGDDTNPRIATDCGAVAPNIFKQLGNINSSFMIFSDGVLPLVSSLYFDIFALNDPTKLGSFSDFQQQAAANSLPDFSIIEPNYESETAEIGGAPNDDHPPANIQLGQVFVYQAISALFKNPSTWESTALFITYDENGGFFDHMVPPKACDPGGSNFKKADYAFDRLGFRVPLIVVSPYAKAGYVSKYVTDHTSILRFVQAWKGLGALNPRDANAWPMLDLFDFTKSPGPPPDISGLAPTVDPAKNATCPEK